jgi:tryptophan synthase alpha chain
MKLKTPQLIGFGISDRKSYLTACQYADGAIIGSAFIKHIKDKNEVDKATTEFINLILKD